MTDRTAASRAAAWLLGHRAAAGGLALALTLGLGAAATRVRLDLSVEQVFPVRDPARAAFDRWRAAFPAEDGRAAVVVAAPDVLQRAGLLRLSALERDLASIPGVRQVLSPASLTRAEPGPAVPVQRPLLSPDLPPEALAARVAEAGRDPLLAWQLLRPGGDAAFVLLSLDPAAAGSDGGRRSFLAAARAVLERHERPGQRLVLTGVPAMRAELASLLASDLVRVVPAALLGVLLLVLVAFRSPAAALASAAAGAVSLVWTAGALGLAGWSLGLALGLLPVLVVIVSVGDSSHLVAAFAARRRDGLGPAEAAAAALGEVARPCLVTELVLSAGFLSLAAIDVEAIVRLGLVAALAMPLTWAATMLVTPLLLAALPARSPPPRARPAVERGLRAVVAWTAATSLRRPRRVLAGAAAVALGAALLGSRVEQVDFIFDDLRPGTRLEREVRAAEALYGGYVPVVVHVEADGPGPAALEPAALALCDRVAAGLRELPEVRAVGSPADLVRAVHLAVAGPDAALDPLGLPESSDVTVRELARVDPRLAAPFVSADRRHLQVVARVPDVGTRRARQLFAALDDRLAAEVARAGGSPGAPRLAAAATGPLRLLVDVDRQLVGGLALSFAGAVLVSLLVMSAALGSWRLGLVALLPNAAPMALVPALMVLLGIPLQPTTALCFSVALVVADDDTIQLLSRVKDHHAREAGRRPPGAAHRRAVLRALREAGPPMLVSALAVSLGFALLGLSSLRSTAWLGLLVGGTLLVAVLADLLLTPLLVAWARPLRAPGRAAPADRPAGRTAGPGA